MLCPKTIGRALKLHRDKRPLRGEEAPAVVKYVVDQRLTNEQWQKFVHNEPLVVPRRQTTSVSEEIVIVVMALAFPNMGNGLVVKEQERRV